jgi:hypothetical protein
MKRLILFCFVLIICSSLFAQTKIKKTVYIILDGIPADVIEKAHPPYLNAIAKQGGYSHAMVGGEKGGYSETPTISAVGYNSILTGTWVNKHNVWDNDIQAPNYNYKNIFRLLKENYPEKKIGIFSSWQDNRTKLVGEGLPEAGNIKFDYSFDGLELDTINYPHDKETKYMQRIDEKVSDEAAATIKNNAPDLSWVYLEYTDDMGHRYGDSPQFLKAIADADNFVGRIWESVEYRQKNFNEDWLIIVTTDHGRDPKTGHGHGGQSDRERAGWIFTNAKNLNEHFKNGEASIVDIMPTIARFMKINIPEETAREIDGVPLIGDLSFTHPSIEYKNNEALIQWKANEKNGDVKIFVATTNNFKSGGKDEYHLIKQVPVKDEKTSIDLKGMPSSFYKFFLEGANNNVNRWLIQPKE